MPFVFVAEDMDYVATITNPKVVATGTNKAEADSVPPSQWIGIPELSLLQVAVDASSTADSPKLQVHRASLGNAGCGYAHFMFDGMPNPTPAHDDHDFNEFMENIISEGRDQAFHSEGQGQGFDPDETQSQDGRGQDGTDHYAVHKEE